MSLDRFVGIPWVEKGRGFEGCDCWGLLRLVYLEECGVELPGYGERYETVADRAALAELIAGAKFEQWSEIPAGTERAFDAVLIREGREQTHIGLVVTPGRCLHVDRGNTSVIESYRHGPLKFRTVGFYRHQTHE